MGHGKPRNSTVRYAEILVVSSIMVTHSNAVGISWCWSVFDWKFGPRSWWCSFITQTDGGGPSHALLTSLSKVSSHAFLSQITKKSRWIKKSPNGSFDGEVSDICTVHAGPVMQQAGKPWSVSNGMVPDQLESTLIKARSWNRYS